MKKIVFILIFASSFVNGQDIKELYIDKLKSSWEVYESETFTKSIDKKTDSLYRAVNGKGYKENLLENQKKSVTERAKKLKEIIELFKIKLTEFDSLAIIEQKSSNNSPPMDFTKKGAILTKNSIYGFTYNPNIENGKIKKTDYFKDSENPTMNQAKQIIGNLILRGKTNYLDTIAKVESDMFAGPLKELRPEIEIEVILYNKNVKEKLRLIYLHETFVQIMNQKK
ncbi:hypothetical protein BA195_13665 [Tenacibaculum soleae]|uniref:Uncharacterized protein n=1 Tax=Tenacibaculum soleae TaxID=447689 RepID=A0A1B9XWA1_9FLAO|nr:hypothetical protein [Tenacibaculum soleae]OCK41834.1 hypothetical protein BA195_13665 [Tenacibaculum soleae]